MAAAMHRTFTPELDPGTLRRLEQYAAHFAEDSNRPRQRAWCGVHLAGLLQDRLRGEEENLLQSLLDLPPREPGLPHTAWSAPLLRDTLELASGQRVFSRTSRRTLQRLDSTWK